MPKQGKILTENDPEAYLYHVTPKSRIGSIATFGLDPILATGKRQLVWYVDHQRVPWALAHCSLRHGVAVSDLVVCKVKVQSIRNLKRTAWRGVFNSPCHARIWTWHSASEYISDPTD